MSEKLAREIEPVKALVGRGLPHPGWPTRSEATTAALNDWLNITTAQAKVL